MKLSETQINTAGKEMFDLVVQLFPMHRSMTGNGVRQTLQTLQKQIPLHIHEVPTGTKVFDWEVPQEWNIRGAYIKDSSGEKIVDYRSSNLHVVSYSQPIHTNMTWRELKEHVHTLPNHPDWIPYRTAHFQETWGFCLPYRQVIQLDQRPDEQLEVCIDAELKEGSLTYGELFIPGESEQEVLLSCHICHPSLANDNLSGIAVATQLAKHLLSAPRRYSYRFIFIPATIGAITWLSLNEASVDKIAHGLILTVAGDQGCSTYKRSRQGQAEIDRAVEHVLKHSGAPYKINDFQPIGYDQRQFCSPGFDLPMGCLMRTPNGQYPEYHTSADNLDLVKRRFLADTWSKCMSTIDLLEHNRFFLNQNPKCEPQLGRHGLYRAFGRQENQEALQQAVLWVLNMSDGQHSLLDIAERADMSFDIVRQAGDLLLAHQLLIELPGAENNTQSTDSHKVGSEELPCQESMKRPFPIDSDSLQPISNRATI